MILTLLNLRLFFNEEVQCETGGPCYSSDKLCDDCTDNIFV